MFTLAHMTDPHLPMAGATPSELFSKRILGWLSWTLRRRRNHRRTVLEAVMADIAAFRPRHIALSGDLVNISTRAEFAAAHAWLKAHAQPKELTFVPGNHDCYTSTAVAAGLPALAPWMGGETEQELPAFPRLRYMRNIALISLNSAYPAPWREASGRLGENQLAKLAELLPACAAKGLCRIVMLHHPPMESLATSPRKALKDATALMDILRRHGAEAVLYGHNHRWAHVPVRTVSGTMHILSAPSASMAPGGHKPPGGWQLLGIARRQGAWEIAVTRRQLEGREGNMRTIAQWTLTSKDEAAS